MEDFFNVEHISFYSLILDQLKEIDVSNELDQSVLLFLRDKTHHVKKAVEKLIQVFRFYFMYISESLTIFNAKGYDKDLSIIPPPKVSKEEFQQALSEVYHHSEKLSDYQEIYFNRKEIEYIFETYEKRTSGYFIPSINEQLLTQNTQQAKTIELQREQIKQLENQLNKTNSTILEKAQSAKTNNAMSRFIKALLFVHYGADVAENPRKHIAENDSTQGTKYSNGKIQQDFDRLGYDVGLSGRTLQNWLDGVPLPKENGLGN